MPYLKSDVWYLSVRDPDGKWKRVPSMARTKTEAKRLELELRQRAERQRLGLDLLPGSHVFTTVADLMMWWLSTYSKGTPSEERDEYFVSKHVLRDEFGRLTLNTIRAAAIEDFLQRKSAELGPQSLNHLRTFLVRAFNKAIETERFVGANPAEKVKPRKVPKRAADALHADEVPRLLAALTPSWRPLFATALYTGLRKGELFALRKGDVDVDGRRIMVQRSHGRDTTKGKRAEAVPIAEGLVAYLRDAIGASPTELVFPGPDGKRLPEETQVQRILRSAMRAAGIVSGYEHKCRRKGCGHRELQPNAVLRLCPKCRMKLWPVGIVRPVRFHSLRHTTATLLLKAGVPIAAVQRIMRHSDPRITTEIYGHLEGEFLRDEINALPAELGQLATHSLPERETLIREQNGAPKTSIRTVSWHGGRRGCRTPDILRVNPSSDDSDRLASVSKVAESFNSALALDSTPSHEIAPISPPLATQPLPALREVTQATGCLTVGEVAKLLRVSTATVYRMVDRGQLEHFRVANSLRFTRAAIDVLTRGGK